MQSSVVESKLPLDLDLTFSPMRRGNGDPTLAPDVRARGVWWRATRTPEGPATTRFTPRSDRAIEVDAWGPGAAWALSAAPDVVGANDSIEGFAPRGKLAEIHRRFAGLRITKTRAVFEAAFASVLEQQVSGKEARTSLRRIVHAWSERAPGPVDHDLMLPPLPDALLTRSYVELRPFGVEMKRAGALRSVASRAHKLEEATSMPRDEANRRLRAVPGIGQWTAAEIAIVALGDADAVSVGDYHLKNTIAFAFTGAPRGDDAQMLELLAPYAGHRGRVVRLLHAAGIHAPRFGPRMRLRPWYA